MNIKDLKLSEAMTDAIKLGRYDARMGVTLPDGTAGTLKALGVRGLAEKSGDLWIFNATGLAVRNAILNGVNVYEVSEDHPTASDMITDADVQVSLETVAQHAAVAHYLNATSEDTTVSAYDSPKYLASKDLMMSAGMHAYPDLSGEEIYELIHSFNEGESLKDLVDIFRDHRDAMIAFLASETNELPGDAERIFDMENAALEGADIHAEYEAEVAEESNTVADYMNAELDTAMNVVRALRHADLVDALISEIVADDRLMHLTAKGVFVSGEYVNTMRRIADVARGNAVAWSQYQRTARIEAANGFAMIDEWVESGKITFGCGDKQKRIIRNICRPHIGPKRKPSSSKRRSRR